MFGISYGEIFLLIGVTAAVVGPKDLPRIGRMAGRLAGRSIGYIQLARAQFDYVLQHSKVGQVHKELQDLHSQVGTIGLNATFRKAGPLTRDVLDGPPNSTPGADANAAVVSEKLGKEQRPTDPIHSLKMSGTTDLHSRATAFARLAESTDASVSSSEYGNSNVNNLGDQIDLSVLPVSAEMAKLLPTRKENAYGSDIVLESVIEAEVAQQAKDFFSRQQNQIPSE